MEFLSLENKNGILILTIDRPKQLNALNKETLQEINQVFLDYEEKEIKGIIVTGSGEKAFVAGADIKEIASQNGPSGYQFSRIGQAVFNRIESFNKPVLAYINGYALGGGLELAMACHMRFASENAKMGQPETKLGVIPGYGGTQRLPRLIGKGRAIELILSGKMIDAQKAFEIGLVNDVTSAEDGLQKTIDFLEEISKNAPGANHRAVQAITKGLEMPLSEALDYEASLFGVCCSDPEKDEGTAAFLEKRNPKY